MANETWQQSSHSDFVRGAFYGLAAVSIWAAFIVVSRLGVRTSLTPWDVAAIRFGTAGLLLLPYLMKRGLALDRLGWIGLAAISVGCGAPMVLLVNAGLLFAPAAHGGAGTCHFATECNRIGEALSVCAAMALDHGAVQSQKHGSVRWAQLIP